MTIRKRNDLILSIMCFMLGLYLLLSKNTVKGVMLFVDLPPLAEPRAFVQIIGGLLILFSTPVFVKSISLKGERESSGFKLKKETLITLVALILFVPAYKLVGFPIASFALIFGLSVLFGLCEEHQRKENERTSKKKFYFIRLIYSAAVVSILLFVFAELLKVKFF